MRDLALLLLQWVTRGTRGPTTRARASGGRGLEQPASSSASWGSRSWASGPWGRVAGTFQQGSERIGETTYLPHARLMDWVITTPLLLLGLALLERPRARDSLSLVLSIMAVDLYMIVTGLFGDSPTRAGVSGGPGS